MRRNIEIETSFFDKPNRWVGGLEIYVNDIEVEYPDELDILEDSELLELADTKDKRVKYVENNPNGT